MSTLLRFHCNGQDISTLLKYNINSDGLLMQTISTGISLASIYQQRFSDLEFKFSSA